MDLKQLKYFLAIAEERQILGASKRLHMAQPPLSQQLKMLESELGVQLVERGSRRLRLTDAGIKLRDRAVQILELVEATTTELKEMKEGFEGVLSIGTVASSGTSLLPEYIRNFNQSYPKVKFQLWEGDSFKITELLDNGIIEIGIVRLPLHSDIYDFISLPDEPMIAVYSEQWNVGENSRRVSMTELRGKPVMLHRRHEKMVMDACAAVGFEPNILSITDDVRSIVSWAISGIGVALVPKSTIDFIPKDNLLFRELDEKSLETAVAIIWVRSKHLSSAASHFLKMLRESKKEDKN